MILSPLFWNACIFATRLQDITGHRLVGPLGYINFEFEKFPMSIFVFSIGDILSSDFL